jgi:hypothetical protein
MAGLERFDLWREYRGYSCPVAGAAGEARGCSGPTCGRWEWCAGIPAEMAEALECMRQVLYAAEAVAADMARIREHVEAASVALGADGARPSS